MRLQQYITEKRFRKIKLKKEKKRVDPFVRIKKAESIVKGGLKEFVKELSNVRWSINLDYLITIMDKVWGGKNNINFSKDNGIIDVPEIENQDYIASGNTYFEGEITINVSPKSIDFLADPKNREMVSNINNKFAKEFIKVLGHELVHRAQFQRYGGIILKNIEGNLKVKDGWQRYLEYLRSPHEMMAYAQDAAYEILQGDQPGMYFLYQAYFQDDVNVFKKFVKIMKKSYQKISDGDELIIE